MRFLLKIFVHLHKRTRLAVVMVLGFGSCPAAEPLSEPNWTRLVEIGKKHGLPFPDEKARLALIHSETWTVVGNRSHPNDPANYYPGWVLEEMQDRSLRVLVGLDEKHIELRRALEPLWREFSMVEPKAEIGGYVVRFNGPTTLVTAVQCAALGKQAEAVKLWRRLLGEDWYIKWSMELPEVAIAARPESMLAEMLIGQVQGRIDEPNVDYPKIEVDLNSLIEDFPVLADKSRKTFLHRLHLTNSAPPAKPGSVEALLIELGRSKRSYGNKFLDEDWDKPNGRIARMGFDAVPELLHLQNDERLTSWSDGAMMMRPATPIFLGGIAQDLLQKLLPQTKPQDGRPLTSEQFVREWERIRSKDEQDYYAEVASQSINRNDGQASATALAVIAQKASERLPAMVERFIKEAEENGSLWDLAQAVIRSSLSAEKKTELLLKLTRSAGIAHRRAAIQVLAGYDPTAAIIPARQLVKSLPRDSEQAYWTSEVSHVSHVVLAVDDDEVWQTFFDKAHEAAVGQRLEWMNPFDYLYVGDRLKSRRLAFLAGFLDDTAQRDKKVSASKFEGPCAAFTFPKINARDFAAMEIAGILHIDRYDSPDETWTTKRWQELRDKVTTRLANDGIKAMTPTEH